MYYYNYHLNILYNHCVSSPCTYPLSCHGKWSVEPLLKGATALKDGGQEEVEQGPEFRQLVLQWSTSEEETAGSHIVGVQHLGQFTVVVLHSMTLIDNHVLPTNLREEEEFVFLCRWKCNLGFGFFEGVQEWLQKTLYKMCNSD